MTVTGRSKIYRKYEEKSEIQYIKERCPRCRAETMYPLGGKFRCDSCKLSDDYFQDGDSVEM